ncbi:MAG: hypothetical protein IID38_06575 [Planctomycetes bacterium]|nr:hypothetical protein [Planctomycetota bacterium]
MMESRSNSGHEPAVTPSMERALAGTDPSDVSSTFHRVVECLQELSSVCFLNQE